LRKGGDFDKALSHPSLHEMAISYTWKGDQLH
jgi:hypothetical protein